MAFDADSVNSTSLVRIPVKSARLAADKSSPLPRSFQRDGAAKPEEEVA